MGYCEQLLGPRQNRFVRVEHLDQAIDLGDALIRGERRQPTRCNPRQVLPEDVGSLRFLDLPADWLHALKLLLEETSDQLLVDAVGQLWGTHVRSLPDPPHGRGVKREGSRVPSGSTRALPIDEADAVGQDHGLDAVA